MPRISVVIPSYNHATFIDQAIESILDQSESDLELIIVDDGSTDESLAIIKGYKDRRVTLIEQSNQGAHAAINCGLNNSHGTYVSILNSDDIYHPNRLKTLSKYLEANPNIGLVGSYIEVIDHEGRPLGVKQGYKNLEPWLLELPERSFRDGTDLRAVLLTENCFATTSNFMFRRVLLDKVGEFRPHRYVHDWDFALRMALVAPLELVSEQLLQYRVHATNTIRENQAAMIFEICWILAVHLPKHLSDTTWFQQVPLDIRSDQLLHSIYTFNCDRILTLLLLQGISNDIEYAVSLLDPLNPIRGICEHYILRHLNNPVENYVSEHQPETFIAKVVKKLRSV